MESNSDTTTSRLAHTTKINGDFIAWTYCPCYACRDYYDPSGQEDTRLQNSNIPSLPLSPPVLQRQNAICFDCEFGHPSDLPCLLPPIPLSRATTGNSDIHLPPPPPAVRMPRQSSSVSNIISPIAIVMTPQSLSEPLTIEEEVMNEEMSLIQRLTHLIETYKRLETHIENEEETARSHGEMMMYQMYGEEVEKKRVAVEELCEILKK